MNVTSSGMQQVDLLIDSIIRRVLEELGVLPKRIPWKEMIERNGRGNYDRGERDGYLNPIKKGGTIAAIYCLRSEFEDYESHFLMN